MIKFTPIPKEHARSFQRGGKDAYGHVIEKTVSDGEGNPCRHCLRDVPQGADLLVLAYRPFTAKHPYAETGPIFLCAAECDAPKDAAQTPEILLLAPDFIVRGYSADERIVYGTGSVVARDMVSGRARDLLKSRDIAFVHVRSSRNNCFQLRIDRV